MRAVETEISADGRGPAQRGAEELLGKLSGGEVDEIVIGARTKL